VSEGFRKDSMSMAGNSGMPQMIRIFLTSSTDFTFDRAIAWAFDAANKSYLNVVRHLEDTARSGGWIGAMLILEPRLSDRDVAIEIGRIRPKTQEAEVDVFISPGVFRGRTSAQQQAVIAEAFARALESVLPFVEGAFKESLDLLCQEVRGLNAGCADIDTSGVAGLTFRVRRLKPRRQKSCVLVVQIPESAIPEDRDLLWLEEWVQQEVAKFGEVDGNDVGGGKVNIFVHCRSAEKAAAKLSAALAGADFARDAVVAMGSEGGDEFKVVWPVSADGLLELF
jgi:hypothetical protein